MSNENSGIKIHLMADIPNAIKDPNLSLQAKGLFSIILNLGAKVAGGQITSDQFIGMSKNGRDAHLAAIKELKNSPYLTTENIKDKLGKFCGTIWHLYVYGGDK